MTILASYIIKLHEVYTAYSHILRLMDYLFVYFTICKMMFYGIKVVKFVSKKYKEIIIVQLFLDTSNPVSKIDLSVFRSMKTIILKVT